MESNHPHISRTCIIFNHLTSLHHRHHEYAANSKQAAVETEDILLALEIEKKYSYDVQERVMKAVAMSGYVKLALQILDSMLAVDDSKGGGLSSVYIPSYMAYTSVLNRLRKWKKVDAMREMLEKLSTCCKLKGEKLDLVALNTYLAALCDSVKVLSSSSSYSSSFRHEEDNHVELLVEAVELLRPGVAMERFSVRGPDAMSFNTVLNAAASVRNDTMIAEVVQMMKKQEIASDIVTHNAMLKAAPTSSDKVAVVDEILGTPGLALDKYTVELALLPLAEEGRIADLLVLLRGFSLSEETEFAIPNTYSAFLLSLVKVRFMSVSCRLCLILYCL